MFKLPYLPDHIERLLKLVDNTTLREQLTTFPLAKSAEAGIRWEGRERE